MMLSCNTTRPEHAVIAAQVTWRHFAVNRIQSAVMCCSSLSVLWWSGGGVG